MSDLPKILDAAGRPIASDRRNSRITALAGGGGAPYDAADSYSATMAAWQPYLYSPDQANIYRDRIAARVRDIVRNDGWASGIVTRTLDNVIGPAFRPVCKPDYRALQYMTGIKGFTPEWADEYGRVVEARYRMWALDEGRYCDVSRALTFPQIVQLAFREKLVTGDALGQVAWLPKRIARGRARYATAINLIDSDRLSNPQNRFDTHTTRGGVEIDEAGAAIAYHIRRAHQGDWFSAADSVSWDRVPRETSWGRPIIVHDFDRDQPGQHRGVAGIFAPILARMKMLVKYDGAELEAATLNAIFSAYIESPFDMNFVEQALGESEDLMNGYQSGRAEFHEQRRLKLAGARIPTLYPGEKITSVNATRPATNFGDFENAFHRNFAAATGLSAQQVSNNWSDVNYSSARGAMLEAWKTLTRRRADFATGFVQPIWAALIEEMFENKELPLPSGAPDYVEMRTAYSAARWIGPGRGWVDPVDEKSGAILGMGAGLSTLEQECAENVGADWEEILDQRAREVQAFKDRGLDAPDWVADVKTPSAPRARAHDDTRRD